MIANLNSAILSSKKIKIGNESRQVQLTLNVVNLVTYPKKNKPAYNSWLWDDQTPIYWNKDSIVLINND